MCRVSRFIRQVQILLAFILFIFFLFSRAFEFNFGFIFLNIFRHGKTDWLSYMVSYIIQTLKAHEDDVIAFTFTNAAADTLRERIKTEHSLFIEVSTMHSFCNSFTEEGNSNACVSTMVKTVVAMDEAKRKQAFQKHRRRKYIFVDESQDCNSEQFELIKILKREWDTSVILVGDQAQSIFSFQGAVPELFLNFSKFIGTDVNLIQGNENYRSTPAIVDAINANLTRFGNPMISKSLRTGPKPELVCHVSGDAEVASVCEKAKVLMQDGVPAEEIIVLNRTNAGLTDFCFAFMSQGIDVDVSGGHPKGKIQLRTRHSSKGGTWTAAFVTGCSDDPMSSSDIEEEQRLFHVAISRARTYMRVSYTPGFRERPLTRYIQSQDISHYSPIQEGKGVGQIRVWRKEDHIEIVRSPRRSQVLLCSIEEDIATMGLELVQSLLDIQDTCNIARVCTLEPRENEDMLPQVVDFHSADTYYYYTMQVFSRREYFKRSMKDIKHNKECRYLPRIFDKSVAERVLLPPCKKSVYDALTKFAKRERATERTLSSLQYAHVEDSGITMQDFRVLESRLSDIVNTYFRGSWADYMSMKRNYNIDFVLCRKWSRDWDSQFDQRPKRLLKKMRQAFVEAHEYGGVQEPGQGEEAPGSNCMKKILERIFTASLFADFVVFTRHACEGLLQNGGFSVVDCIEDAVCIEDTCRIVEATKAIQAKTTGELQVTPSIHIHGEHYFNFFDFRHGDKYYNVLFEHGQTNLPLYKFVASILSTPPEEDGDIMWECFNAYTGQNLQATLTAEMRKQVLGLYSSAPNLIHTGEA